MKEPELVTNELSTEANEPVAANKDQSLEEPGTPEASKVDNAGGVHEEGKEPDTPLDKEKVESEVKEEGKEEGEQAPDEDNTDPGEDNQD